jgi:hypothetical protein
VVSGQLEDSLRHEIESFLEGRLSAIRQEIVSLQSQLNESLANLLERQGDVQMDGSLSASITEHLRAAHESGVELAAAESSRAKASSDMAIVKAAITEINEQTSQAEILKVLINRATSFAPRVAFFVIKGDQTSGWRGRGFEGTVGDETVQQISFPVAADTVIGSAARSLTTWSGGPGSHSEDHLLINKLGEEPPQRIVAIPLIVRKRAVAVLYADSAGLDSESINLEALETLVRVSGMAVELQSISKAAPRRTVDESATERAPAYAPTSEYQTPAVEPRTAEPSSSLGVDTLRPESFADVHTAPPVAETFTSITEDSSTDAGLMQEAPAWRSEPATTTTEAPRRRYGQDIELPVDVASDEERRYHQDARRFAKLLIDEIKLYNEQKVAEGRIEHDLYDRLREYIDRSREMYDKRVKAEVSSRYDYFHDELVNKLAEGDVSKLGSNYPGATVTA